MNSYTVLCSCILSHVSCQWWLFSEHLARRKCETRRLGPTLGLPSYAERTEKLDSISPASLQHMTAAVYATAGSVDATACGQQSPPDTRPRTLEPTNSVLTYGQLMRRSLRLSSTRSAHCFRMAKHCHHAKLEQAQEEGRQCSFVRQAP